MREFMECEKLIKETINTKCRILDKQKILAEIKQLMKDKFGIEINCEYIKNMLLSNNKYKILLDEKKQTILLQNRTKSEYTKKYCSEELRRINKSIKQIKNNLDLDYFQYINYSNRINKLMNYNNLVVQYYDISMRKEHTLQQLSYNTICLQCSKQINRKCAIMQQLCYNAYVQKIEDSKQNRLFRIELSDITQKKKRQIEYKQQLDSNKLNSINIERKQNIIKDKLIADVRDKIKSVIFV